MCVVMLKNSNFLSRVRSVHWPCLAQLLLVEKAAYLSACWLLLVYSEKQLN
jgi:phosphatidylglycerophosphate synthase